METNKELNALFKLIDDPDEEVFSAVTNRLIVYGKSIIPQLEHLGKHGSATGTGQNRSAGAQIAFQ